MEQDVRQAATPENHPAISSRHPLNVLDHSQYPPTPVQASAPPWEPEEYHLPPDPVDDICTKAGDMNLMNTDEYFRTSTLSSIKNSSAAAAVAAALLKDSLEESESDVYGELVVYGTTPSRFPGGNQGRRRSSLVLKRRTRPNGVTPSKEYYSNAESKSSTSSSHVVSYSLSRSRAYVVEYAECPSSDLFQIGRSTESNIDLVVIDTVPGATKLEDCTKAESTISRYACRITCNRTPSNKPEDVKPRVFAAGFDANNSIQLGERAMKWEVKDEENGVAKMDGLTTNGVLIFNPDENGSYARSQWREVSVCGHIYTMRDGKNKSSVKKVAGETNILRDGCLIDLCGVTLIWKSASYCRKFANENAFVEVVQRAINKKRPQCPVNFNTLYMPKSGPCEKPEAGCGGLGSKPYACFPCGHVYGHFTWGEDTAAAGDSSTRECPLCRRTSKFVPLTLGDEPAFHLDSEPPTYAFNPCGHTCSLNTAAHWSNVVIPSNSGGKRVCPFCAVVLKEKGYIKLIFQDPFN